MPTLTAYLKEKASVKTQYEAMLAIRTRLNELGLMQAPDPEEMVDIAISNGVAGSGKSQHSPLYVYDKKENKLIVSYEHICFDYPLYAGVETYQIIPGL